MTINAKELSDEELEEQLDKLCSQAPERITKKTGTRKAGKKKEKTVSNDAIAEAMAKLLEGKG